MISNHIMQKKLELSDFYNILMLKIVLTCIFKQKDSFDHWLKIESHFEVDSSEART